MATELVLNKKTIAGLVTCYTRSEKELMKEDPDPKVIKKLEKGKPRLVVTTFQNLAWDVYMFRRMVKNLKTTKKDKQTLMEAANSTGHWDT